MRYTFEVTTRDDENVIKLDIAYGSMSNMVTRTLTFKAGDDDNNPNLDDLLSDMVNNMRLTVKEREEAIYNAKVFKDYVQQYKINYNKVKQEMIVENGDPSVLGDPDKYIK